MMTTTTTMMEKGSNLELKRDEIYEIGIIWGKENIINMRWWKPTVLQIYWSFTCIQNVASTLCLNKTRHDLVRTIWSNFNRFSQSCHCYRKPVKFPTKQYTTLSTLYVSEFFVRHLWPKQRYILRDHRWAVHEIRGRLTKKTETKQGVLQIIVGRP